ncbi:hypothetical protein NLJ89_g2589 [Agrocybe chaxingu]|uniref:DDE-1 domain-containing protein n=1 Tax=Agrocybe chaxingu TaxID=84603 RepID=A0A9W8MWC1_9AGAR|nr:hypothetical protein NLJ89_g2589 [Agrocybe chaxingu]
MTQKKTTTTQIGPSQALVSRINHLRELLKCLPSTLPLNPATSSYDFGLDPEKLEDRGPLGAVSHSLEVAFRTFDHRNQEIHFTERGDRLEALVSMLKLAVKSMSNSDRQVFQEAWLEQLITAAERDGAKIPAKSHKRKENSTEPIHATQTQENESSERPLKRLRTPMTQTGNCTDIIDLSNDSDSDQDIAKPVPAVSPSHQAAPALLPALADTITAIHPQTSTPGLPNKIVIVNPQPATAIANKAIPRVESSLRQGTLQGLWKKAIPLSAEERARRAAEAVTKFEQEQRRIQEAEERQKEHKAQHNRDLTRERQRRFREKKKAEKEAEGHSSKKAGAADPLKTLMENAADGQPTSDAFLDEVNIAEKSRPGFEGWRDERNGSRGGAKQSRASKTNWYHPFLWVHINTAMRKADWSAAGAELILKRDYPLLFKSINRGTIWKWVLRDSPRSWSPQTLSNVTNHHSLTATGRTGVLGKHMDIVDEIKKTLKDLRVSGIPVHVPLARSIMLAIIEEKQPSILNKHFQCSELFVRSFFQSVMNWTPRMATRAAAHIPSDAPDVCERAFFRIVYAMKWENIPPKLVINVDQMGMYVLPSNSRTFHDKGASQVDAVGKDEKRAYTVLVASTPTGDILPFQQVWAGKTNASLPRQNSPGMAEAKEFGFHFAVAASQSNPRSHFSTLKTMIEWIEKVMIPWVQHVIEVDGLNEDQKAVLYIDCYPVHAGEPFKTYVYTKQPNIIICFVPRNCTPVFQPADVGLQRPIKHILKQELFKYLARTHREQISSGLKPEDVWITTSLPKLRDASVLGLVEAYKFLLGPDGRDLIKKSWVKSVAKNWNLSEACLTSKEAQIALKEYLRKDSALHDEIASRMGAVLGLDDGQPPREADMDHAANDDTDIPIQAVISDAVESPEVDAIPLDDTNQGSYLVHCVKRTDDGLVAGAEEEDVWAYGENGLKWVENGVVTLPTTGPR